MKRMFHDTGPGHPHYNMALDEALLEAHRPGELTLRLYAWKPWALSLGYFQPAAQADPGFLASAGLVLTRRATGGGAIVHADELTYSLVADAPRGPGSSRSLYALMNGAIARALRRFGVEAAERGAGSKAEGTAFLCFERHADFDLAVRGRKISGSAQRRLGGALLQHGSVLLGPPPVPPAEKASSPPGGPEKEPDASFTWASAETGRAVSYGQAAGALLEEAAGSFGGPFEGAPIDPGTALRARELERDKYGSEAWIRRL
jgi:lipoate-protein ligase A